MVLQITAEGCWHSPYDFPEAFSAGEIQMQVPPADLFSPDINKQ